VQWVKPELETDPNHWVLRVEGETFEDSNSVFGEVYHDLSLMWYVATPEDNGVIFEDDSISGVHAGK